MPEPLLLVPGLMCTADLFAPQIEAFAGTCEVIVAEHTRRNDMTEIARQILADAPERFALAGLSMGVYLSLEIVSQAPERVTRLALLDGKARPDTPEQTAARHSLLALADEGRFLEITTDILLSRLVAPGKGADPGLRETIIKMAKDTGEAAFRRQIAAIINRRDYLPVLESVNCPALVLTGLLDAITPAECAREMAGLIANAQLTLLTGCGHLSTLEAPREVNAAMHNWLHNM
jgi:pimeloyl-ACP methyl ester carboxylesterase